MDYDWALIKSSKFISRYSKTLFTNYKLLKIALIRLQRHASLHKGQNFIEFLISYWKK
jgi:hypothetical protein